MNTIQRFPCKKKADCSPTPSELNQNRSLDRSAQETFFWVSVFQHFGYKYASNRKSISSKITLCHHNANEQFKLDRSEGAYIRQFHTFTAPQRDPRERVITIAYYALVRMQEVKGGDDAADARWFALDEVPQLAFDHDQILRKAEQALRQQIHFEPVGFELLPEEFTIKELQNLYEAILNMHFDRRNFYNKMKRLEMLEQMDETVNPSQKKEAFLFRFNKAK